MGKVYDGIDDRLTEFLGRQHVFFVGTAPTDLEGHQNVSPKGLDIFRLIAQFPDYPGVRSVIAVEVNRIADSCGFAVPCYEFKDDRSQLIAYAENKGPEAMEEYKARKNARSIDGIAGLRSAGGRE